MEVVKLKVSLGITQLSSYQPGWGNYSTQALAQSAVMSSGTTPRDEKIGDIKSLLKLKKKYDAPDVKELPESYRVNSEKEKLWLWCANNMLRQIKFDFPHLRPLCLAPENECGVKKLICTFIKVFAELRLN